jgi:hypothetical protein
MSKIDYESTVGGEIVVKDLAEDKSYAKSGFINPNSKTSISSITDQR